MTPNVELSAPVVHVNYSNKNCTVSNSNRSTSCSYNTMAYHNEEAALFSLDDASSYLTIYVSSEFVGILLGRASEHRHQAKQFRGLI